MNTRQQLITTWDNVQVQERSAVVLKIEEIISQARGAFEGYAGPTLDNADDRGTTNTRWFSTIVQGSTAKKLFIDEICNSAEDTQTVILNVTIYS